MDLNGKRVDLALLADELQAAGVPFNALGTTGDGDDVMLWTYDADGALTELPTEAIPVVDAHVAPPLVVEFVESRAVEAVTRTTDGAFREIWRIETSPRHSYRSALEMRATDAMDGTHKAQEARLVFKGLAGSVVQVGTTTVLWSAPDPGTTAWAIQAQAQGTALVFGVRGAAGRTIDWSLAGEVVIFAPEGLG